MAERHVAPRPSTSENLERLEKVLEAQRKRQERELHHELQELRHEQKLQTELLIANSELLREILIELREQRLHNFPATTGLSISTAGT